MQSRIFCTTALAAALALSPLAMAAAAASAQSAPSASSAAPQAPQNAAVSSTRFPHWLQKGIYPYIRYFAAPSSCKCHKPKGQTR